jgi:integrase
VRAIKQLLWNHERNYCLFVLGINSALRPEDLRIIRVGQVRGLKPGDSFEVREEKTGKYRRVGINKGIFKAIQRLLGTRERWDDDDYLFTSRKGGPLQVSTICAFHDFRPPGPLESDRQVLVSDRSSATPSRCS